MAAGADGGQGTNPRLGDAFSLSVAIWYSGYFLSVKAARATAGAMRVTFWATLLGTPLLLIVALVAGRGHRARQPGRVGRLSRPWASCTSSVRAGWPGRWASLPASITAVTILVQPVVAGLLGWWVFGETLTPVQALGGVLVLGAVVLAQRSRNAPDRPPPTPFQPAEAETSEAR